MTFEGCSLYLSISYLPVQEHRALSLSKIGIWPVNLMAPCLLSEKRPCWIKKVSIICSTVWNYKLCNEELLLLVFYYDYYSLSLYLGQRPVCVLKWANQIFQSNDQKMLAKGGWPILQMQKVWKDVIRLVAISWPFNKRGCKNLVVICSFKITREGAVDDTAAQKNCSQEDTQFTAVRTSAQFCFSLFFWQTAATFF